MSESLREEKANVGVWERGVGRRVRADEGPGRGISVEIKCMRS